MVLCWHLGSDSPCLSFGLLQCGDAVSQALSHHIPITHFCCYGGASSSAWLVLGTKPLRSCHSCRSDFHVAKYPCGFISVVENILIFQFTCFFLNRHQSLKNRGLEAKNIRLVEFCFLRGSLQMSPPYLRALMCLVKGSHSKDCKGFKCYLKTRH